MTIKETGPDLLSNIIEIIAGAVDEVADSLSDHYDRVQEIVDLILGSRFVHVVGVGKSGHIGQKMSKSLCSIGVPSSFLHPTDMLHGDVGQLKIDDLVLFLSYSGESQEILDAISAIRKKSPDGLIRMAAIGGFPLCRMHQSLPTHLGIMPVLEAGPVKNLPTSSTTCMMFVCDVIIAMTAWYDGLDEERFLTNHPGGRIGFDLRAAQVRI